MGYVMIHLVLGVLLDSFIFWTVWRVQTQVSADLCFIGPITLCVVSLCCD